MITVSGNRRSKLTIIPLEGVKNPQFSLDTFCNKGPFRRMIFSKFIVGEYIMEYLIISSYRPPAFRPVDKQL